jgi:hypothetical protein
MDESLYRRLKTELPPKRVSAFIDEVSASPHCGDVVWVAPDQSGTSTVRGSIRGAHGSHRPSSSNWPQHLDALTPQPIRLPRTAIAAMIRFMGPPTREHAFRAAGTSVGAARMMDDGVANARHSPPVA